MTMTAEPTWHYSSTLEKLLEHRFLSELTTVLWCRGERQIEILKAEVDDSGYDVVLEVAGVLRHIQLKTRRRGGKRTSVRLNTRLATKPSGCAVMIDYDENTLALGPYFWLGAEPGKPLPSLGDKMGKHTKGNSKGEKLFRPSQRVVSASSFEKLSTMSGLASRLFGQANGTHQVEVTVTDGPL